MAAIVAVSLATGIISYRIATSGNSDEASTAALPGGGIAELERKAKTAPDDAAAWQELGFAYFDAGRFEDAAAAYEKATNAAPKTATLWSSLGEARVMASQSDPMPKEALEAFRKAAELDPADPRARYFFAVQKDLEKDHKGALADWLALLADTPPGAPWESDLKRTIEQVGKINGIPVDARIAMALRGRTVAPASMPGSAVAGPTQEQLAAASKIPPSDQREMAEGMVERLAQRLSSDPTNVDGWIMLMRSYMSLGRESQAKTALASALAANPAQASQLRAAAEGLGIGP